MDAIRRMFDEFDSDGDGRIDSEEFADMVIKLNVAPRVKKSNDISSSCTVWWEMV